MTSRGDIEAIILDKVRTWATAEVRPELTLDACGLDSLEAVEVHYAIEDHFGIGVEDGTWDLTTKVGTIVADVTKILDNIGAR